MYATRVIKNIEVNQVSSGRSYVRSGSNLIGFFIGDNTMKEIKEFPGYFVTRKGEVYSDRKRYFGHQQGLMKLKFFTLPGGYSAVGLHQNKVHCTMLVHRLVARAFVSGRSEINNTVRHKDDDRKNNSANNLLWGTPQDNSTDMVNRGRQAKGSSHGMAKLTEEIVIEIRALSSAGVTNSIIAIKYGVNRDHVAKIVNYKAWIHV